MKGKYKYYKIRNSKWQYELLFGCKSVQIQLFKFLNLRGTV